MTKEERLRGIEKIWKKHATGQQNLICTYLPHANQKALFNELNQFMENHPSLPKPNIIKV